jgi:hypothetical protein
MPKDDSKTEQNRKAGKVGPDPRGRSVWLGEIEPVELELVSTDALQKILKTEGGETSVEIRKLAAGRKDGVLARETATGRFQILSDADLRKASEAPPGDAPRRSGGVTAAPISDATREKAEELSLVSTQRLRKLVNPDSPSASEPAKPGGRKDKSGGFNPYDNS